MKIIFNHIFLLCLFFLSFGFITLGLMSLKEEISLDKNEKLIESKVINWRVKRVKHRTNYDVQYTFSLQNDSIQYTRSDFTGRKNLWSRLSKKNWNKTKITKKLMIVYDSTDPWNSKIRNESNYSDSFAALIFGIICSVVFIVYMPKRSRK